MMPYCNWKAYYICCSCWTVPVPDSATANSCPDKHVLPELEEFWPVILTYCSPPTALSCLALLFLRRHWGLTDQTLRKCQEYYKVYGSESLLKCGCGLSLSFTMCAITPSILQWTCTNRLHVLSFFARISSNRCASFLQTHTRVACSSMAKCFFPLTADVEHLFVTFIHKVWDHIELLPHVSLDLHRYCIADSI